MQFTNTTETGFEELIENYLVEQNEYEKGTNSDYNQEYAIDEMRLFRFLNETQPQEMAKLRLAESKANKLKFLNRLLSEIFKRGIVDVLRNGIHAYPADLILFYMTPSEGNETAKENFAKNIFSVTRQLRYSAKGPHLAVDMCVFINGLPVMTFELKNRLTHQTVEDAVEQYKNDRDPREPLFIFGRCMAHFALDDANIKFCTKLAGKDSWFLPFDKGYKDGAGNPPNPGGIMTDYLWKDILAKDKLSLIIENYAQIVTEVEPDTRRKKYKLIFPRYHQLDAVTKLLADVRRNGVGRTYLIQHSAGSGKSNSITWLAHQLAALEINARPLLDSVLVVTDRRVLDKQIRDNIKRFMQVKDTMAWAETSSDLRKAIQERKRIIVTTIEKFPYILPEIGISHKNNKFAIIIDEAHSSQSGSSAASMQMALGGIPVDKNMDEEDVINALMEGRKHLPNASYFAFTATPKNKTLELFGNEYIEDGEVKYRPFHSYTMKQAIQEKFILDVLEYYTSIDSYYKLRKLVEDDPEYDKIKAHKKLRSFVESNAYTIAKKAAMMVEHFLEQVIAKRKIGGMARAMVVTSSIQNCLEYYFAIQNCLEERNSPYKAVIAFSGEHNFGDKPFTSERINGFADGDIPAKIKKDPYRILVAADMFQTGYDEPLLHTMYVDKPLSDIKGVQTLSRLNRVHPLKRDCFVLDFANSEEIIEDAFARYYRRTLLVGQTDPNKLYDLIAIMDKHGIFSKEDMREVVSLYISNAERTSFDAILDACAALYLDMDADSQIEFKGAAKSFVRFYEFIGSILPYGKVDWERLNIFLHLLIPRLPSPKTDDLSEGILERIDLDSYRLEAHDAMSVKLEDEDAEIGPVPIGKSGHLVEPELDPLSKIILDFNQLFGNIQWQDKDNVDRQIAALPEMVSKDRKYQNAMRNSDEQEARTESDRSLMRAIQTIMMDNLELYKQFHENPYFQKWLSDAIFTLTYNKDGLPFHNITK